jgi:hypothetical protein
MTTRRDSPALTAGRRPVRSTHGAAEFAGGSGETLLTQDSTGRVDASVRRDSLSTMMNAEILLRSVVGERC